MLFHALNKLTREDVAKGNVKTFTLDKATPFLMLPGLVGPVDDNGDLMVSKVTVSGVELPPRRNIDVKDFRLTAEKLPPIKTDFPMYTVVVGGDGIPVLLRSMASNNGLWQAKTEIAVWGEWEGMASKSPVPQAGTNKVDPVAQAAEARQRLMSLPQDQLVTQAIAMKIMVEQDTPAETIIAKILEKQGLPVDASEAQRLALLPPELVNAQFPELRQIGDAVGVPWKPGTKRIDYIAAIAASEKYKAAKAAS